MNWISQLPTTTMNEFSTYPKRIRLMESTHPYPLRVASPPPSPKNVDFQEDSMFEVSFLKEKNPFPFDHSVLFKESTHKYAIKDENGVLHTDFMISVSSFMAQEKDDSGLDHAARFSVNGFRKKLCVYLQKLNKYPPKRVLSYRERHAWFDGGDVDKLTMDYLSKSVYEKLESEQPLTDFEQMELYGAILACENHEHFDLADAKRLEYDVEIDWSFISSHLTDEAFMNAYYELWKTDEHEAKWPFDTRSIRKRWSDWQRAGTMLHAYIEHALNEQLFTQVPIRMAEHEIEETMIREFLTKHKRTEWVRTELRIGSLPHRVCGTMDALAKINGEYVIFDWKRSRNVFNPIRKKKGRSFASYQLQLTCYKKLLALNGIETSNIGYLVVFHPLYPAFQEIAVDLLEMKEKVDDLFHEREVEIRKWLSAVVFPLVSARCIERIGRQSPIRMLSVDNLRHIHSFLR